MVWCAPLATGQMTAGSSYPHATSQAVSFAKKACVGVANQAIQEVRNFSECLLIDLPVEPRHTYPCGGFSYFKVTQRDGTTRD